MPAPSTNRRRAPKRTGARQSNSTRKRNSTPKSNGVQKKTSTPTDNDDRKSNDAQEIDGVPSALVNDVQSPTPAIHAPSSSPPLRLLPGETMATAIEHHKWRQWQAVRDTRSGQARSLKWCLAAAQHVRSHLKECNPTSCPIHADYGQKPLFRTKEEQLRYSHEQEGRIHSDGTPDGDTCHAPEYNCHRMKLWDSDVRQHCSFQGAAFHEPLLPTLGGGKDELRHGDDEDWMEMLRIREIYRLPKAASNSLASECSRKSQAGENFQGGQASQSSSCSHMVSNTEELDRIVKASQRNTPPVSDPNLIFLRSSPASEQSIEPTSDDRDQ